MKMCVVSEINNFLPSLTPKEEGSLRGVITTTPFGVPPTPAPGSPGGASWVSLGKSGFPGTPAGGWASGWVGGRGWVG